MKFLKGLALFLLGICLYMCLSFLGMLIMLNSTLLNPDFILREMDKLAVYDVADELVREQVMAADFPPTARPYVEEALDKILADLRPWVRQQTGIAVNTVYDYFQGRSQHLSLFISLEPVRDSIKQNLEEVAAGILAEIDRQVDQEIPASLEFDQADLDVEAVSVLEQVRSYISRLQLVMILVVVCLLLAILGIVLIIRDVRASTRSLGTEFLVCGLLIYVANLLTRHFLSPELLKMSLPADFQMRLPQLMADIYAPLDIYAIVVAAVGAALLTVSFVYRPRQAAE